LSPKSPKHNLFIKVNQSNRNFQFFISVTLWILFEPVRKAMKFVLILLFVIVSTECCSNHLEPQKMPMVKAVMTKCLNGKESITIFEVENSVNFTQQEIKIFQVIESIKPVIAFNNITEALVDKINDMAKNLKFHRRQKVTL
jgi:hypothetical protein